MSVSCRRGAIFQKFSFFMFGFFWFYDFGGFWVGLGRHFESQRATKMASKFDATNDGFLDRSRNGFGKPLGGLRGSKRAPKGEEPKGADFWGRGVLFMIRYDISDDRPD